jgi:hypothetical protein
MLMYETSICITPKDMLAGRQQEIHAERDRKLEEAKTTPGSSSEGRVKNEEHVLSCGRSA